MRRPRSEVPLQQQRRLFVRVRCEKADGHEPRRAAAVAHDAPAGADPLLPDEELEACALRHGQLALRLRREGVRRDQPRALRPFGRRRRRRPFDRRRRRIASLQPLSHRLRRREIPSLVAARRRRRGGEGEGGRGGRRVVGGKRGQDGRTAGRRARRRPPPRARARARPVRAPRRRRGSRRPSARRALAMHPTAVPRRPTRAATTPAARPR